MAVVSLNMFYFFSKKRTCMFEKLNAYYAEIKLINNRHTIPVISVII